MQPFVLISILAFGLILVIALIVLQLCCEGPARRGLISRKPILKAIT